MKNEFKKYMHVERFGNTEVQNIEFGKCYIFPKIDGTNASLWLDDKTNEIKAGSRNRELSLDNDNSGFMNWAVKQDNIKSFFKCYPDFRLYGEWLVPHSLKTYRESAWRNFYVFDVQYKDYDTFVVYEKYKEILEKYNIEYIPPISIVQNATYESLLEQLKNNTFLINEGSGFGEGIVLKNYQYQNKFGRTVWAKLISNEFKEKHIKKMGSQVRVVKKMIEQDICDKYVTKHLVEKTYSKIINDMDGWTSKYIPRLIQTVFYDLVKEETWNFVKAMKNPTINFKTLNTLTIMKVKDIKPELF